MHGQQPVLHIYCPGLYPTIWRGHSSLTLSVDTTRRAAVTGYKPQLDWRKALAPGVALGGGRDLGVSLGSYRPPQAGQSPVNKVLSRHSLLSSLGAWGLGILRTVDCNIRTKHKKYTKKETSS